MSAPRAGTSQPEASKDGAPGTTGRLAGLGLILFGLAVAFLVFEAALRLLGLNAPAELDATFDRPIRAYRPQAARANPWSTGHPDPLRVAVIGDSFTDGQGNHGYDAYPARLEALLNLNAGQRPVAVRAYAERGSPTHGQIKFLRRAIAWEADVVILGIFLNDAEIAGDHKLHEWRLSLLPRIPKGRWAWALKRSAALGWIYQRLENLRCARATSAYFRHLWEPDYEGFAKFKRAIRTFRRDTNAAEIAFLPVIFPGMATLGPDYASRFIHQRIHPVLEDEGLEYLDLLDAFEDKMPLRVSAFPVIDPHPSEIAHRIAADAIFHRLLADGTIDPGYEPERVELKSRRKWLREVKRMKSVVHLAPDP